MPLQVPPENLALCTAIVEVGRVAAARLTVRDAALGFSKLTPPQRTALAAQAERWTELANGLVTAWRDLPPDRPARRLAAMVPDDDALLLLALAAAPQLDRTLARAYGSLIGTATPGVSAPLTVGVLLDLASPVFEHRLGLAGMLHARAALRAAALVELRGGEAAQLDDQLVVAGGALAALRGEPITPGAAIAVEHAELEPTVGAIVEAALTLPRWRPGTVTLVEGAARDCAAILTLRAAIDRRPVWRVEAAGASNACRDAALAAAHVGVAASDVGRDLLEALTRAAAATRAVVVLTSDGLVPPGLPADTLQLQARSFRGAATPAISGQLGPGPVRAALEILSY